MRRSPARSFQMLLFLLLFGSPSALFSLAAPPAAPPRVELEP